MGSPIRCSNAERVETTALNTKVNKETLDAFKDCCKESGYQLNVVLETFMRQYANGRFILDKEEIIKWKKDDSEEDTLSSTFNKEIYTRFKDIVKKDGYFVKHVISAFIEDYVNNDLTMEFLKEGD